MKINIRNLGAISQAEIDLKPLTIFIGPNNTGKTWTMYALSAILGRYGWDKYLNAYIKGQSQENYPTLDAAMQQLLNEGNAKIDIVRFASEYGEKYLNDVARSVCLGMGEFLATKSSLFEKLDITIRLEGSQARFLENVLTYSLNDNLAVGQKKEKPLLNIFKEPGDKTVYYYTEGDVSKKLPLIVVKNFLFKRTFEILHQALYIDIIPFPSERTTIITFPLSPSENERRKGSQKRIEIQGEEFSVISPVLSFFRTLQTLYQEARLAQREELEQLADILETEILGGVVDFSTPEPGPLREIIFQPPAQNALEMNIVSSMVKELSAFGLYLKYRKGPRDLVIMDEPEMNLHPAAQVRLMELLVMLVNAGVHVLFTTHTTYLVDHLVNLMKAAEHPDQDAIKEKFFLKRKEAFIPKEQVSVYLFGEGTAKPILNAEGLIDWGTFADVSNRVSQIYFEL